MKTQTIEKIMTAHSLPFDIAERLVDDSGNVDPGKLEIALAGISWGKNPAASADPRLIQALSDAYYEAVGRKDFTAQISLKNRIFKMGGQLMARKK
jgi:hypothetical protein